MLAGRWLLLLLPPPPAQPDVEGLRQALVDELVLGGGGGGGAAGEGGEQVVLVCEMCGLPASRRCWICAMDICALCTRRQHWKVGGRGRGRAGRWYGAAARWKRGPPPGQRRAAADRGRARWRRRASGSCTGRWSTRRRCASGWPGASWSSSARRMRTGARACLPACLPARLPARLPACLPARLPACPPARLPALLAKSNAGQPHAWAPRPSRRPPRCARAQVPSGRPQPPAAGAAAADQARAGAGGQGAAGRQPPGGARWAARPRRPPSTAVPPAQLPCCAGRWLRQGRGREVR
jgi:hypothetical protein